jgi:AraC family transcriptional regulator, positive regulator of tynA and feaB
VVQTWSTLSARPARQFSYWRELICEAFLDLTPESDLRDGFLGSVAQRQFGALSLARIDSQRQRVRRTAGDIAHGPRAGYYANLQVRGVSAMAQGGRVTVLRPGDIAIVDTSEPFGFEFRSNFQQLSFFVPAPLLDGHVTGGVRTAARLDTSTGIGAAVRHVLHALSRAGLEPGAALSRGAALSPRAVALSPDAAAGLATHAAGLLGLALDLEPDPDPAGARSARTYAAALADIEEHLADDDLSPAATAQRLGVSVRWLHRLFAGHQHSYAATVRRLRLERARHDLRDPARRHLRVIDVAAAAGFADVTSFHRAFRREFGRTPGAVRTDREDRRS